MESDGVTGMERTGRIRERHLLELLESRQLMSAGGGVDVALVDSTLPQYRQLVPAIHGKVIEFDGKNDSAAKVLGKLATWASATGTKINSISILSHGSEGKFRLGNEWISTAGEHEKAWRRLRGVLDAKAQIYVFGCSVAGKKGNGQMLLDHLATLSGVKVFGSTGVTGKGGNWLLEASSGVDPKMPVAGPVNGLRANSIWAYKLAPGITVTPTSGLVTTEAGGLATFDLVLDAAPVGDVVIPITSSDTAEGTVSVTSLTFTPADWNTAQTVTVTGVDDAVDDGDKVFTIVTGLASSTDPAYDTLDASDVSVTNLDDDTAGITVSPTSGLVTSEAGAQATFDVVLTSQPTSSVTIAISSSNTAEGTVSAALLTFTTANWNVPKTVTVTGVNDFVDDGNVGYTIVTGAASSLDPKYSAMDPADVAVTNSDDDTAGITVTPTSGLTTTEAGGQATFDVVLLSQPTASVTISIVSTNTAEGTVSTSSLTFTTANWNVPKTVTVTGVNDFVDDGAIAYSITTGAAVSADPNYNGMNPANVSVSNADDDTAGINVSPTSGLVTTEAGGVATFTVVLTSQPTDDVTVPISSSNTAEGTVSASSLTFTPGNWNVAQTVTVTGANDFVDDGNQAYTLVTGAATSTDGLYNGVNPANVSASNTDDDTAGISVSPTSGLVTTEAGGQATFAVALDSQPTNDVTIALSSSNTAEGTVSAASITFTALNWNIAQTVTVTGVNDAVDDGNQAYSIVTAKASSADVIYKNINASDVSVSNTDDDIAGITVTPTSGLTTTEAGGQASFNLVLDSQPTGNVTVSIASSNTAEGTVSTASVVFTPANWNVPKTVTATGVNDFVADGNIGYTITTGAATSTDANYSGVNPADVSVTNNDNDIAGFTVTPTSGLTTTEAGGQASFDVTLTSQPLSNVTVSITSTNTAEGTVSTSLLTFTVANWNVAHTVTVTGVNDLVDDGDIAYSITTGASSSVDPNYNGINPSDVSVTNTDNDTAGITVSPTSGLTTTEAGVQASFTVVLTSQPTADVTIPISSSNAAEGTVSTASLTFTAVNWNVPQTVTVTGQDDFVDDGNIAYSIITGAATSGDGIYNGINPANVSVTNTDNDVAGITVTPTSGLVTTEAGALASFNVALTSQPTADVTIAISSSNGAEGTASTTLLTFTAGNWNIVQTVTVTGQDDFVDDGNISYSVITAAAASADANYNGMNASDVTLSNTDDDTAGITVSPTSGLTTSEAGSEVTFDVVLNSQPTGNVTIAISSNDLTEGTVSTSLLTFTAANWNIAQTVTVSSMDDVAIDGDVSFNVITGAAGSADPLYSGMNPSDVTLTNRDNDPNGVKLGSEFRVNTTTAGSQGFASTQTQSIAMDADGNFVVTWSSSGQDGSGYGIYAQLYNASGTALGGEILVNTTTANDQQYRAVAMAPDGSFVVVWSSNLQDGSGWGVYGQRFDAAGVKQGGEFRTNQATAGDQKYPAIAIDSSGNFVVTWVSDNQDGSGLGVYARRYSAAGTAQGNEFKVNGTTGGDQDEPSIAMASGGAFVVTWTSGADVWAQRYSAAGAALGGEFRVNSNTAKTDDNSVVAMDAAGNFVVVWNSNHQDGTGNRYGIFGQRYNAAGAVQGTEFQVNTFTGGNQRYPSMAMAPAGDFVVTWTSDTRDGSGWGVFGQQYQADATPRGGEFRMNTYTTNDQLYPSVAMDATGDYVAVWSSYGQDGSLEGIYGQRYEGGNDAPVNSVPGAQAMNEDTTLTFGSGNGNAISIGDFDAGSGSMQVTLSVSNGALTLSQLTGLTFTAGTGTANSTMTFTGTIANINAALNGMSYTPTSNFNGSDSVQITTSDLGNSGWGTVQTDSDSVGITVNPVNDAPVNSVPGAQSTNEDTALVFSSGNSNVISIGDVDASSSSVRVTLTATNGTLTLSQLTGLTFTTGTGTANSTMTFTGTMANINAALQGLSYAPVANYNGAAAITIFTEDLGNTGGGNLTDSDTVNVTVNAVNDAPVNAVPAAQSVNEDNTLVFSSGNGNAISIGDLDAGGSSVKVTLSVTNGALTLSQITGLTFTTGDGTADASMVFTGTVANINAALAGMSFAPTGNFNGSSTLQIVTDDQGNTGSGGTLTDTDTVSITVNAVNDAPVNTVPGAQSTNEDTTLVFSSGNGNRISIADLDAASGIVKVTLMATNGALTLSQLTGLTFSVGDGTSDGTMTFTGTIANINAALNGLGFLPSLNYNGAASVAITTDDQGNVGIGGALADTDTVNVTVNAVNDAPVNTVPVAQSTNEDTVLVFSGANGNQISVFDLDVASGNVRVTLTATNGLLTLSQLTGLAFSGGDGTSDGTMTFTGTLANVNAALNGLSYLPNANYNGPASVSITTDDQGNVGIGGVLTDTDSVGITVNAVNDAPVNSVPGAQSTNEDTTLVFSGGSGNPISISDLDAASGIVKVTLTATNGALTLSQLTGLTFSVGDGTSDGTMTFTGTMGSINAALNGLAFLPSTNYNGPASVAITTDDQGNVGIGGALADTDTINITVNAVNDPPVNAVPAAQATNEDTAVVFSGGNGNQISISDLDTSAGTFQVTLTASNGVVTLSQLTGLSFSVGDGSADGTMTFTGTMANINAALNGLAFLPSLNYNGPASVTITTDDQGNLGLGGALTDTDTVNITVNAVNDAPANSVPGPQSTNEDTTLVFSGGNGNPISISDLDTSAGIFQVTLTASNGVVTLSQLTGLSFSTGDGTSDGTMTFTGTMANINAALNGLSFLGTLNYNGPASLTIITNDQGNLGIGSPLSDTDTVNITIDAVNDAPVNSLPAPQSTNEDTAVVFSGGNGNQISISDLDASSGIVQVTLTATNGVLTLSQLSGLAFSVGDGAADVAMTFSGTMVDINAALNGMSYVPNLNYNGPASVTITTDDQGNVGIGGALSDTDTVNLTVNAVNDAPVNLVPVPQATNEDTVLVFSSGNGNQISISDLDAAAGIVQVTLTAANGMLTLSGLTGLTFISGDGSADGTMTFTGTIGNINAALNGLSFLPSADYNGPASVSITTDDQGNVGIGGALSDTDTVNITVIPVNDNPTIVASGGTLAYTENDGPVVVDGAIVVGDIDSATLAGAVIRIVGYVGGEDVLSFTDQNGISGIWDSSTGALTLSGVASVADYQLALRSITYTNTSEAPSVAGRIVRFRVNDGALDSGSTDKNISITERNDAPVISVPGGQQTDEDVTLMFSSGTGNAITISDIDARTNLLQVTIAVLQGKLSLGSTGGLVFSVGDGTSDATMTFTGTLAQINAALDGLTYLGNANYNGADAVSVDVDDLGNMGIGGPLTDSASVPVTVNAVNDVPVNSVPGAQSTNEDTPLVFSSGNGNLISVGDLDVASGIMKVTLSATNGFITLGTISGLTFITGDGIADGTMTFTGDIAAINAALDGLIFDPPADYNGPASITITTDDQGNTGQGGNLIDSDTVNITVNAVNDAPIVTVPPSQVTDEDTNLVFSTGNGNAITINDIDLLGGVIQVTLTSTNGLLTLSGLNGLTFSVGDGAADGTMTFTGTLADVNAAVEGLFYSPNLNYNGPASITVSADDLGQTGIGGALSDSKLIFVDVDAVNDAPVNSVPVAQSTNEDTPLVFSSGNGNLISIADLDVATGLLKLTLSVAQGSLTLADLTGLTFIAGDGAGDGTMTFTGTLADINAALNGLSYVPALNYNGPDTLTITTNDQGNVGTGGNLIDTDTVSITVNAVNDAPIIAVPVAQNVNEDAALVFSSGNGTLISVADLDVLSGMLQVTISVMNGKLTLSQLTGLTFILGDGTSDVTMTFLGSLADVNAALDGMKYKPDADYFGSDTVSIAVDDEGNTGIGGTLTDSKTVDITVDPVNDAPVITRGGTGITYTENDPKTAIDAGISLGDVDNITLNGAVIRILNYVAGEDLLSFLDQNGISGTWDAASGTLTLSGIGSVADYQTALRSITYSNTSENPRTTPRAVRFTVNDGNTDSAAVDYAVSIVSVNDKPTGRTAPDVGVSEDSEPIGIALWKFFADAEDKDSDLVLNVTGNTNGALFSSVSIDPATGRLIMEYAPDANGDAMLTIRATDRGGKFVEIQIKVRVDAVNDSPKIATSEGTISYTASDTTIAVDSGISLGDIDSGSLTSATMRLLDYNPGEDVLRFVSQNGITADWDAKTGTLTLMGTASVADYENALQSVTYENRAGRAHPGNRTIEFGINDGQLASNIALRSIDVEAVQQVLPPVFEPVPPPPAPPAPIEPSVPPTKPPEQKRELPVPVRQPVSFPQPPAKAEEPAPPPPPAPAPVAQVEPKPEPKAAEPVAVAQPTPKPPDLPAPLPIDPPAIQIAKPKHYETAELWKQLDLLNQQITDESKSNITVGAVGGLTTTLLSVGYVIWCLRGGTMVATLLTTLPLWRFMDPLPVLEIYEKDREKKKDKEIADEDEERLRSMMD